MNRNEKLIATIASKHEFWLQQGITEEEITAIRSIKQAKLIDSRANDSLFSRVSKNKDS